MSSVVRTARAIGRKGRMAFRYATSPARALPDFVIIGAQKSGTSSLFWYLMQHPWVIKPLRKEVHFLDNNSDRSVFWYRAHFPFQVQKKRAGVRNGMSTTGEATPNYIFIESAAERLHAVLPAAKLIVSLRDPVSRAYSHYQHSVRKGREPLSFEDALDAESSRLKNSSADSIRNGDRSYQYYSYVARGKYVNQLRRWVVHYPRTQILLVSAEQLFREPHQVYNEVIAFLGLPSVEGIKFKVHNSGNTYPPMAPATEARLRDMFTPYNQELKAEFKVDFDWIVGKENGT